VAKWLPEVPVQGWTRAWHPRTAQATHAWWVSLQTGHRKSQVSAGRHGFLSNRPASQANVTEFQICVVFLLSTSHTCYLSICLDQTASSRGLWSICY